MNEAIATGELDFDPTRALPNAAFRDSQWLAAEKHGIWHGDWVFATTEDAVPSPGDRVPVRIGDQPVLLLRNEAGKLAALSNLCAHRGTLLVERPDHGKRIRCPYHAWTYDDAGRLLGAPFAPKGTIDKEAHSLPAYRVETWHGLVFVSLNPDVEPLAERFAAVEAHVSARAIDAMRHHADRQTEEVWECNWKVAIVNAMESYHLFRVHPDTLEPWTPTSGAYYIAGSARATATGGAYKGQDDYLLISLPPAFVGVLVRDGFMWLAVHPIDTHRCSVRTGGAFASRGPRGLLNRVWESIGGDAAHGLLEFTAEDKAICERVQRGVSGDFAPGRLVPLETGRGGLRPLPQLAPQRRRAATAAARVTPGITCALHLAAPDRERTRNDVEEVDWRGRAGAVCAVRVGGPGGAIGRERPFR